MKPAILAVAAGTLLAGSITAAPVATVPVPSAPQDCHPTASDPNAFTYEKMGQIAQQDVQLPPVIERRGAHPADEDILHELDRGSARPVPHDLLRHKNESEATEPRNSKVREMSTDEEPRALHEGASAPKMKRGMFDTLAKLCKGMGGKLHAPSCSVWKPWFYSSKQYETKPPYKEITPEFNKAWKDSEKRQGLRWKNLSKAGIREIKNRKPPTLAPGTALPNELSPPLSPEEIASFDE
ncbi:hypothetical protein D7B24_008116 [Verticillium nonalfalfae]|uniref:Uncharacterized protein n=1 Tax=Verticillium nonalfalfae TaxID=1051616 RepID=A0A3M9YJP1_9PEZI|nr:uncharacterized protein D7B24_008116 [Verticillium nonalfalfae]RNJ60425.1 hypothetical protein D7B24_008116 [Verticillium nonalfalfae]